MFFSSIRKLIKRFLEISFFNRIKKIIDTTLYSANKIQDLTIEGDCSRSHFFSIIAIIKNESKYIREWIEYHTILGVEHFYLYDNESDDNLRNILLPYIEKGIVTYIFCPGKAKQIPAYNDAIVRFKKQNHWMAFIDADEFIVLKDSTNKISHFMKSYEQYDMLCVNWIMFDYNNHENIPNKGFVISNFTRCFANEDFPINRHLKCIVKPKSAKICINPHYIHLKFPKKAVDERFGILTPPFSTHVHAKEIRINHYFSKSKEEYLKKISRGNADSSKKRFFDEKAYNFSYAGTRQSEIDLSFFINILKEKIPETYR